MFDVDGLVADLRACLDEGDVRGAVKQALSRALASRTEMAETFRPEHGRINTLHRADDLTVLELVWPPDMQLYPHDHRMWACIGIYTGQEDNTFFRRRGRGLVDSGGKTLAEGDVTLLGDDTIHAVHNPLARPTAAIHVYGGDFFNRDMTQWDPETLEPRPEAKPPTSFFEEANERLGL